MSLNLATLSLDELRSYLDAIHVKIESLKTEYYKRSDINGDIWSQSKARDINTHLGIAYSLNAEIYTRTGEDYYSAYDVYMQQTARKVG